MISLMCTTPWLMTRHTLWTFIWLSSLAITTLCSLGHAATIVEEFSAIPEPPVPEPIAIRELPLPPVITNSTEGACTASINPARTGCIAQLMVYNDVQVGSFLPDNKHVVVRVSFVGAPAAPDPASIYTGGNLILVKTDNTTFRNGDPWRCITCGVSAENSKGRHPLLDYPQAFTDGQRILADQNIVECDANLASSYCTPDKIRIFPIYWPTTADGSGTGGTMRELRINPDGIHILWNSFVFDSGRLNQFSYFGKLFFNSLPTTGQPAVPRYEVKKVTALLSPSLKHPLAVDPHDSRYMIHNASVISIGETRGFTGDGRGVTYIGFPVEGANIDAFEINLSSGKIRRITTHPEYIDPLDISPDGQWSAILDTRGSNRQMFMSGLRQIPPLLDVVTAGIVSSVRNNGPRRFFQPWLLDYHGDRGSYFGQRINAAGDGIPGNGDINDPEWNAIADPKWSPDGTYIAYGQALTVSPSCGGSNPLPCYTSTAPGGRNMRIMLAHLTSRKPQHRPRVRPVSDLVPWGTPYIPGQTKVSRAVAPAGNFILRGHHSGWANVTITHDATAFPISVTALYHDFCNDGSTVLRGWENATRAFLSPTNQYLAWYSDLIQDGPYAGTKKTSAGGLHIYIDVLTNLLNATGTLVTKIDGVEYAQPANGT